MKDKMEQESKPNPAENATLENSNQARSTYQPNIFPNNNQIAATTAKLSDTKPVMYADGKKPFSWPAFFIALFTSLIGFIVMTIIESKISDPEKRIAFHRGKVAGFALGVAIILLKTAIDVNNVFLWQQHVDQMRN